MGEFSNSRCSQFAFYMCVHHTLLLMNAYESSLYDFKNNESSSFEKCCTENPEALKNVP